MQADSQHTQCIKLSHLINTCFNILHTDGRGKL